MLQRYYVIRMAFKSSTKEIIPIKMKSTSEPSSNRVKGASESEVLLEPTPYILLLQTLIALLQICLKRFSFGSH